MFLYDEVEFVTFGKVERCGSTDRDPELNEHLTTS